LLIAILLSLTPVWGQTELVANGGFESGLTGWTLSGGVQITPFNSVSHSGRYYLLLGGRPGESDLAYQTIFLPCTSTSALLSFYYNVTSTETNTAANDTFTASICDPNGNTLATVTNLSNLNRDPAAGNPYYHLATFDLLPYAGQTIRVSFSSLNDSTAPTSFRVDDVSLQITQPQQSPAPQLLSVDGLPASATVGQPFTVTVTARNNAGIGGTNSLINASILYSNGPNDLVISNVAAPWADGLYNYNNSLVQAIDNSWRACEEHSLSFSVTPLRSGTLYTRVRVTLRDGDTGTNYVNDASGSGGTIITDEQGYAVRQYATTVLGTGTGFWTLAHAPPSVISLMLLLSDGTVLVNDGGGNCHRLIPDANGSYVNGTWTNAAWMHDGRSAFSSIVLRSGNVLVAGGEHGTGGGKSEIYDPLYDRWTPVPVPNYNLSLNLSDTLAKILPNGDVLACFWNTIVFSVVSNAWFAGPSLVHGNEGLIEASWVKLADDSILTVDPDTTFSERYIPSLNQWVADADLPVPLYDYLKPYLIGEIGPALLLPNGKAIFFGGSGHTALYTPSGNIGPGSWEAGPDIPDGLVAADAPAAMLANGRALCAVAPPPYVDGTGVVFPGPTSFYEYDYASGQTGSFRQVHSPIGGFTDNVPTVPTLMLALPDGTVLFYDGNQLYSYQPDGAPLAAGKPIIGSITQNSDGSFHLAGTNLNGISEGAAYGDDAQMDSNYPLVRMTNAANGLVYYGRTFDWSSTGVMTGDAPVSTEFTPPDVPPGTYSLVAVANGIASDPVQFVIPNPKFNQTITFGSLANKTIGESPFGLNARAGSGQRVTFQIVSGPATISGNMLSITGIGSVIVRASQPGNSAYSPAPDVDQAFTVYPPPLMSISQSSGSIVISWPTNVAGFGLESAPALSDPWSSIDSSPAVINGRYTISLTANDETHFYRLRK
jgi:hypothetical protein